MDQKKVFVDEYGAVAKFFHWTIAILVFCNYLGGLTLDKTAFKFIYFHKQFGMTILLLVWLRIFWRIFAKYPNMASELSTFEKFAARCGHYVLYLLTFTIPTLGIILVQSRGYQLSFWGMVNLPQFIAPQIHSTAHAIKQFHEYLAHLLIICVILHGLFAIWHHFINKNSILLRMLPNFIKNK